MTLARCVHQILFQPEFILVGWFYLHFPAGMSKSKRCANLRLESLGLMRLH